MGIADDVITRSDQLSSIRSPWEPVWGDCVALCLPMHAAIGYGFSPSTVARITAGPVAEERGRKLYDSVGAMAVDRLTAGVESLVTPQSETWHGVVADDPYGNDPSDVEQEWFDWLTKYLFRVRYDTRSGFVAAHQTSLRSCIALGTGVNFVEECYGQHGISPDRLPMQYQNVPLNECLIAVNSRNEADTLFRRHSLTARQICQKFKDGIERVPTKIREAANDAKKMDNTFDLIHATFPREEYDSGLPSGATRNAPFASCVVDLDSKTVIRQGGYYEFPFGVYYWHHAGGGYAECPVMFALAELKSLQVMNKTTMRVMQQMADPPLALAHDGVTNRPNLNPRAINPNALTEDGKLKIQPIITSNLSALFLEYIAGKREITKETLYLHLFQTLIRNPSTMTATEALIRANEKGELLGPSGSKIQSTMSRITDRELGILGRKGLFDPGRPNSPPPSLGGRDLGTKMTSPLDRIRRAKELLGAHATVERMLMLAQHDPAIMDKLDGDAYVDLTQTIEGAPRKILKSDDEVKKIREARNAAANQAQQIEQGKNLAEATVAGAEAMDAAGTVAGKYGPAIKAAQAAKSNVRPGGPPIGARPA